MRLRSQLTRKGSHSYHLRVDQKGSFGCPFQFGLQLVDGIAGVP